MKITRTEFSTALITVLIGGVVGFELLPVDSIPDGVVSAAGVLVTYLLGTVNFLPSNED